jgi:hypothetical protein
MVPLEPPSGHIVEVARALHLDQALDMGLVQWGFVLAIARRPQEMEAVLEEAIARAGGRPDVMAMAWGHLRGLHSLLKDETSEALDRLEVAMEWYAGAGATSAS